MKVDPTTREGLEATLVIARHAAREAAGLLGAGFRRAMTVEHKGPSDLVTNLDRDSEELLRRSLGGALPFAIVGEETAAKERRPATTPTFYVDPLDGTTNFVHGHPFWCVSIGLCLAGDQPVLGVVLAPRLGLEWFGWVAASGERRAVRRAAESTITGGAGSVIEEPCTVSATGAVADALFATGFPYDRSVADNNFDAFIAVKKKCQAIRRCGSAAVELCLVADGTYDGYWERRLRPWDVSAGGAIVRAAGGTVTDLEGRVDFVCEGDVVATNGAVHDALLRKLAAVAAARGA